MSASILDAPVAVPVTRYVQEGLAACTEDLARLRFSIVLTAKWEASERGDALHRKELHTDLEQLHGLYFRKIDEIAMNFGVQEAMEAKEKVERAMSVPRGLKMPRLREEAGEEVGIDI